MSGVYAHHSDNLFKCPTIVRENPTKKGFPYKAICVVIIYKALYFGINFYLFVAFSYIFYVF